MAKYLQNNSVGIICIGGKNLIPGADPTPVTEKDIAHPRVASKIANKILTLTEDDKPALPEEDPLQDMTVSQLKALAAKENIDLGPAKSKTDIIAAIHAADQG